MSHELTYAHALGEAMAEEMERDPRVYLWGQDVGLYRGVQGVTAGLLDRFGPERIVDTPISETFIAGGAVGAALAGLRPIAELMYSDFVTIAGDEIINKAGKWRYMHGGLFTLPIVFRMPEGAAGGGGPEHGQCPENFLMNAPGLKIVIPSTPADAKGLLKSAIRDDNPVCFFESRALYRTKGEIPDGEHLVPIGKADIKREGTDVTVVAWARQVHQALQAAEELAREGISVEVVDPRGLRPLDMDTILGSLGKTGRLVFAYEANKTGGNANEVIAIIAEEALDLLAAPIRRVAAPDIPVPQSIRLEPLYIPQPSQIVAAIREVLA